VIISIVTPGSERLLVLKDGVPIGCVIEIDTARRSYKRSISDGSFEVGEYDRLVLSLDTDAQISSAISSWTHSSYEFT